MNKQIVVSEEILYLRQLCDKIKVKCIAGYFKHATEREALIYENIIKVSFKLLESVAGKKMKLCLSRRITAETTLSRNTAGKETAVCIENLQI